MRRTATASGALLAFLALLALVLVLVCVGYGLTRPAKPVPSGHTIDVPAPKIDGKPLWGDGNADAAVVDASGPVAAKCPCGSDCGREPCDCGAKPSFRIVTRWVQPPGPKVLDESVPNFGIDTVKLAQAQHNAPPYGPRRPDDGGFGPSVADLVKAMKEAWQAIKADAGGEIAQVKHDVGQAAAAVGQRASTAADVVCGAVILGVFALYLIAVPLWLLAFKK